MTVVLGLLFFAALAFAGKEPERPLAAKISPQRIEVGAFYDGALVTVEGVARAGSKIIVTVVGSEAEERFNRKGRFGPIWLNSGRVRISGMPSLFLRFSAAPVASILSRECLARHGLDMDSRMKRMRAEPLTGDGQIRADYLALKLEDGSYVFGDSGVHMTESAGAAAFTLRFQWPKKAPPARYEVHVYEARDGAVVREFSMPLEVVRTGFPAWLAEVAQDRPALYGMAAVLTAAFAGFGIDLLTRRLFGRKRRAAH